MLLLLFLLQTTILNASLSFDAAALGLGAFAAALLGPVALDILLPGTAVRLIATTCWSGGDAAALLRLLLGPDDGLAGAEGTAAGDSVAGIGGLGWLAAGEAVDRFLLISGDGD